MKYLLAPALLFGAYSAQAVEQLPDLQTVVPQQLQIQNDHQHEFLRFSNAIANTGNGALQFHPEFPDLESPDGSQIFQNAYQDIFDEDGNIIDSPLVSQFEFHPAHNHWHIDGVALFEVRKAKADGSMGDVYGGQSIKTTFCLVDWYKLIGPSKTPERVYFECDRKAAHEGISPGWADQYHQATPGQELDITGAPVGDYYLVSTANFKHEFRETNYDNNQAWVKFRLKRESKGNAKLQILGQNATSGPYAAALTGVGAPNR